MSALILFFPNQTRTTPSELDAEAAALEAWHGKNLYSDFLRSRHRRPTRVEAHSIGKLMGTRVLADDGSKQPPKPRKRRIVK